MGPVGEAKVQFTTVGPKAARGAKKATALLEEGQKFYPTDWLQRTRPIDAGTAKRGYHQDRGSRAEIKVSERSAGITGTPGLPTAIHELGHEMEASVPFVAQVENAFYEWRTRGGTFDGPQEQTRRLATILKGHGYGRNEITRTDQFADAYMGKAYGTGGVYELLTMGMQSLFAGDGAMDAEMQTWLLGLLAMV